MTALMDFLDAADPWAVMTVITFIAYLLAELQFRMERRRRHQDVREFLEAAANARIQGYRHGYGDGYCGAMPAVALEPERKRDVPEAFTKAFRK